MTAVQAPPVPETHSVALTFEDGVTRFITCRDDQTVADASYRQRINIPLDCRDGACGTCKALCDSGRYDGGTYIDDALSPDEAAAGYVLPCAMKPKSDLVLQIASTSEIAKTQAATYVSTITELTRLSATTVAFSVEIPNRDELVFLPGQYVNINVPDTEETRSYSFSSAPDDPTLSFLVKLTPGGVMSTYLDERAKVGDQLSFTGPNGSFFLRESDSPALLLAGGTGLAPILSILRKMRTSTTRPLHLIYGVNTDEDAVELDTIDQLATELGNLTWDYCVADQNSTATHKGYVTALMTPEHLHNGNTSVYLCGPPPMVEAVRKHIDTGGIQPHGFYYEKFALAHGGNAESTAPAAQSTAAPKSAPAAVEQLRPAAADGVARTINGQTVLAPSELGPVANPAPGADPGDAVRRLRGQLVIPGGTGGADALDEGDATLPADDARAVIGQQMFDAVQPTVTAPTVTSPTVTAPTAPVAADGYEIGEEHPSVYESDALFEARRALELGALELTLGRLSTQQLTGYRLLAEATVPFVDGESFTDAAQYTETNAAFHDYLFDMTGNEHLLQAYQALGVKGRMAEMLRNATWCHPLCAQDHLDIVAAFESGDRDAARELIVAHAERSKQTMRRAMSDLESTRVAKQPKFIAPGRFTGKVVVITGAAQGIGEQTARRISAEGGTLVLVDRSELVKEVADELDVAGGTGPRALAVTADLEQFDGADSAVAQALSEFGRVDVLINNVGGAINFKPFTEFTDDDIRAEITRSLLTTLYSCRAALPAMVDQGHGVIVNVSSAATRGIHRIPYSAAKGGVNALTASLAMEYADAGIRVVATAPGGTEAPPRRISRGTPQPRNTTEQAWYQAHIDQTIDAALLHRYGTLDEQAAAICFLASDEASYITGTVLPVAGGDLG